jgi:hypothetical protein
MLFDFSGVPLTDGGQYLWLEFVVIFILTTLNILNGLVHLLIWIRPIIIFMEKFKL